MNHTTKPPSFGQVKFGNEPRRSALPISIAVGLLVAAVIATVTAVWGDYSNYWENFVIFTIGLAPVCIAGAWVILVDRSSIPRAIAKPEETVENAWAEQAASTSFYITLGTTGLSSAIATLFFEGSVGTILMWAGLAMMAIFAVTYAVTKHKA